MLVIGFSQFVLFTSLNVACFVINWFWTSWIVDGNRNQDKWTQTSVVNVLIIVTFAHYTIHSVYFALWLFNILYRFSFCSYIKRRIYYGYQVHIKSLTKTFLLLRNCSKTPFHKQYFQNEKVVLLFRWIFKHIPCKTWLKFASEQPFFLIVLTEM